VSSLPDVPQTTVSPPSVVPQTTVSPSLAVPQTTVSSFIVPQTTVSSFAVPHTTVSSFALDAQRPLVAVAGVHTGVTPATLQSAPPQVQPHTTFSEVGLPQTTTLQSRARQVVPHVADVG